MQAAAAARVAGGPDIFRSTENGDGVSVLCHLITDDGDDDDDEDDDASPRGVNEQGPK